MLKANLKSAFFIPLLSALILLAGCSDPEEKKSAYIAEALSLAEAGSNAEALTILEELAVEYPNDIEILHSMGQIYSTQGDSTMAAFFIEQAYLQAPDDTERLYQAYQSLKAANQPAGHLLEKLSTQAPEAMTPELWIRLGQVRQAENKVQSALDAYLKGVNPEKAKPSPDNAAAIGQLFVKAGNLPQATTWLEMAADNDDPNALTALFGLLEIHLSQKDWASAENILSRLDQQFPGAVDASEWQPARQELLRWRQAQDAMQTRLSQAETEKKAAAELVDKTEPDTVNTAETADTVNSTSTDTSEGSETAATDGKSQVIADLEAVEAMAEMPAIDATPESTIESSVIEDAEKTVTFDPNIVIEPADPDSTIDVTFDQEALAEETSYAMDNTPAIEPADRLEPLTVEETEPAALNDRPRTVEELISDAEIAEIEKDYTTAIRAYWAAIRIDNNRAETWNLLSRAYLVDEQLNNAETAALEAVRLDPSVVAFTLDYLRVAQRTKSPNAFLAQLETASDRFPASPEITIALARAHERISGRNETALNLYLRFIDIAPNHPLVPEASAAAARLR